MGTFLLLRPPTQHPDPKPCPPTPEGLWLVHDKSQGHVPREGGGAIFWGLSRHCRADGSREAMSPGRAARREGEDATRFSERVKVRRATRGTCERGWGLQPGLHGLGGDEAEDRTLSTAPEGPKPSQAGGAQLHGGARQDCWQQRDGPSISKTSFWGPGQHAAQQQGASPALMFTEGLLWLYVPPPAQTQQQGSGGPAE